jgi:anti-sigma B factor antagonist
MSHHEELHIDLTTAKDGHTLVFVLRGSFDLATAPSVRAAITDASDGKQDVIIDLTQVEFLDSTGLGALIGAHRRATENGGTFRVIVGEGPILRLLNITGLIRVLGVYHHFDDALTDQHRLASTL